MAKSKKVYVNVLDNSKITQEQYDRLSKIEKEEYDKIASAKMARAAVVVEESDEEE